METQEIQVGKTYKIAHSRKGTFTGTVISFNNKWADVEITAGRADAILPENRARKGEEITIRRSLCTFEEVPA